MARPRSDIAPRILAAARTRFLVDGVDGASLRAIAREAGTSIGMVYYYFPTMDDLFLAVVEEVYAKLLDDLGRALAPDAPVDARLRRMYERFGALSDDEVQTIQMLAREALVSSKRLDKVVERFVQGHVPLILATLAEGVTDGVLASHPLPLMLVATMALGLLPQIVRRMVGDRMLPFAGMPPGSWLADQLAGILLQGIGQPLPGDAKAGQTR